MLSVRNVEEIWSSNMDLMENSLRVRDFRTAGIQNLIMKKSGVMCPKCGDDIVIKKTKKGRRYYGCINNPECDFMSWQKPSEKKCPKCGGAMVEKGNKIVCMDEQCGYVEAKEKK